MTTSIVIGKTERILRLTAAECAERSYPIDLGRNWAADKVMEGDHATPLGEFYVCAKNPRSKFFLSLCLSYPNVEDAERGLETGLITIAEHGAIIDAVRRGRMPPQRTRLGGEIYIHGRSGEPDNSARDWTRGCIGLANPAIKEVYDAADIGTPVTIWP